MDQKPSAATKKWWSHRESNPDQEFRKLLFYPLNYETRNEPADGAQVKKKSWFQRAVPLQRRKVISIVQVIRIDGDVHFFYFLV